ncbi:hypothetical protein RF11_07180 [Thelohanellus kitauei]|uniref:Uncharacterized protein n=1 Tax=Thelohanellus kitauei TaxID=669202 RepID=A0A0C2NJP7_THEKT|nr:hypothetical protein RF11_07180 [Thelohanellus kitauei]
MSPLRALAVPELVRNIDLQTGREARKGVRGRSSLLTDKEAHDNILPSPYRKIDSDIVGLDVRLEFNVSVSQFTGFYELLAPSKRKDNVSGSLEQSAVLFSKSLNFEPPNAKIDTVHREIGAVDRRVNNRKVMTKYMDRKTAVIIRHQSRDFNPEALENLRGRTCLKPEASSLQSIWLAFTYTDKCDLPRTDVLYLPSLM